MLDEWLRKSPDDPGKNSCWSGKKSRYILVILICFGLLALIWPVSKVEKTPLKPVAEKYERQEGSIKSQMAAELEAILSEVNGAGKVEVSLSLSSDGHKTFASNRRDEKRESEESQARGIKKNSSEESRVEDLAISSGAPVLVEERFPEVLGVLVVADGGGRAEIKERLTDATATLLNISAHRVKVMPRKGGK
ncbi:MAG: hypothetical protein PHP26_02285 [Syntrophomonas sp.]|uniref:hypothetical protein n=1 Tax=Syntrophomonas sp. TaxID=2053627 RepID=UPI0026018BD2|nr:hypothetical protein [Syntrophomonas sp.]MDD2510244.1 hypothetical protein [Syntrophomonas sp.]MDD3878802.1 hypothetical protein [Syntrophomonas sp.]MDD4626828.1 hypothetical protein [Syntrophomonas sp.]